jgi:2-C-methyl-D-erythritol 4-phosphate cytidylyltransferase
VKVTAIVPAAGRGSRFQSKTSKLFVSWGGKPLLVHTLKRLLGAFRFEEVLVLVARADIKKTQVLLRRHHLNQVRLFAGGVTRADSVKRGLENVSKESDWVLVHDAARPLIGRPLVLRTILAAKATGAALCALPVTATVKKVDLRHRAVLSTEDRRRLYLAQTPQVFRKDLLLNRYHTLKKKALTATDEAALFDGSGISVRVVEGDIKNIKITTLDDLQLFRYYLGN